MMTGPYLARNPLVVGAMAGADALGLLARRRRGPSPAERPLRVLVANAGHLGDLVVMLPLLGALRRDPRIGHVGVLIGPWGRPVIEASRAVDAVHVASHWT